MKRIFLLLLAGCLLLTLAACSLSEISDSLSSLGLFAEETIASTEPAVDINPPAVYVTEPLPAEPIPPTEETTPSTEAPDSSYVVKIGRADFPIYNRPGYDYFPVSTVSAATAFTIVDESWDYEGNLWGKLASGAGWVDLSLNEKEAYDMPPVTVSFANQELLDSYNYNCYYCQADSSEYAYEIILSAHELLTNVSFFAIGVEDEYTRGTTLSYLPEWDESMPLVASVYFPGSASTYGLEFTDSQGITHVYCIWESGRNGSVGISPFTYPLVSAD